MKVKLHAKVAKFLDTVKAQGYDDRAIIQAVIDSEEYEDGVLKYAKFNEIMAALVNGYEAKPSPEEAILKYYTQAKHAAWEADEYNNDVELADANARKEAVLFVLNELGIRIEGVQ